MDKSPSPPSGFCLRCPERCSELSHVDKSQSPPSGFCRSSGSKSQTPTSNLKSKPLTAGVQKNRGVFPRRRRRADRGRGFRENREFFPRRRGRADRGRGFRENRGFFPRRRGRADREGFGRTVDFGSGRTMRSLCQSLCLGKGMSVRRMVIVGVRPAQECGRVGLVHFSKGCRRR